MKAPHILLSHIQAFRDDSFSARDLAQFVGTTRSIAESFFVAYRPKIALLCSKEGLTEYDLALDSIGEIFARDESGFTHTKPFLESLTKPLDGIDQSELFQAYRRFVFVMTEAHINKSLADWDPAGAKILRNIILAVGTTNLFCELSDFRGRVLTPKDVDPLDRLPTYPEGLLLQHLQSESRFNAQTPELLQTLHRILTEQSDYRRSLRLNDLVQIFRSMFNRLEEPAPESEEPFSFETLDDERREELRFHALQTVDLKILTTYAPEGRPGKISASDAQLLRKTVRSIVEEWFDEKSFTDSYYRHASKHLNISQREFEKVWKNKVQVVANAAKESIRRHWKDE